MIEGQINVPEYQVNVLNKFKTGINISYYENYWKKETVLLEQYEKLLQKVELAHRIGFTLIRLPDELESNYSSRKLCRIKIT